MGSIQPSAWTNVEEEAPGENNLQLSIDYGIISGKVDLIEAVFNTYDDFHGDNKAQEERTFNPSEEMVGYSGGMKNIPSNSAKFPNLEKDGEEDLLRCGECEMGSPNAGTEAVVQLKEMIYKAAAMRPVAMDLVGAAERKRRKNVRISSDPQTVAARQRRERISERLRVLRRIVPGGSKMDTASMLDEAANYLKFLKSQINVLQSMDQACSPSSSSSSSSSTSSSSSSFSSSPSYSLYPLSQSFNQLFPMIEGQASQGSSPFQPF